MVNRLSNIIRFSKKNKSSLTIVAICDIDNYFYNYIDHLGKYFVQKYRKYYIIFNLFEPKKLSKQDLEGIHSYPSFFFFKNNDKECYHGINSNNIDDIIFNMIK